MSTRNQNNDIRRKMKKIAVGIISIMFFALLQPAQANTGGAMVIIDTAIDSSAPQIKNNLIYEVCIIESLTCPNGQRFQEGPGAATLPASQAYSNGFQHGTLMTSIATQVNPSAKIIFIRIAGMRKDGRMDTFSDRAVTSALSWVLNNKSKFNIVSVSSSVGHNSWNRTGDYCPIRATHKQLVDNIVALQSVGVPTIFASGNRYTTGKIDFPACIPQAVAVSAANDEGNLGYRIANYSNTANEVDFYTFGTYDTPAGRAVGTSASAVAFSAFWLKNYKGDYQSTINSLSPLLKPVENTTVKSTNFIDILK